MSCWTAPSSGSSGDIPSAPCTIPLYATSIWGSCVTYWFEPVRCWCCWTRSRSFLLHWSAWASITHLYPSGSLVNGCPYRNHWRTVGHSIRDRNLVIAALWIRPTLALSMAWGWAIPASLVTCCRAVSTCTGVAYRLVDRESGSAWQYLLNWSMSMSTFCMLVLSLAYANMFMMLISHTQFGAVMLSPTRRSLTWV